MKNKPSSEGTSQLPSNARIQQIEEQMEQKQLAIQNNPLLSESQKAQRLAELEEWYDRQVGRAFGVPSDW